MWFIRAVGLVLAVSLFFCIPHVVKKHNALRTAAQYDGIVVGHKEHRDNNGISYALEVEYQGADFKTHTFVNHPATNPPAKVIGDRVRIFDHGDGKRLEVLAFQTMYLGYWIWFCISFCAFGCFIAPTLMELIYLKR
ncbi:hypothetical protein Lepto7376_1346 [[Leptolyngbya] sp. PCC 7376]|uniref:hypothetical protein n=1 Tax=[Leptolyngbya] sp. PCC 7376 TaxID=111781 RepID=UPI00029F2ADB|nr:hypothetical protein [[Leptolyngbya] sp. PCC 7376]AFY37698.1 hypothetical protein Lepto7376_1346 [[Leptolyngbya] sp. PCC 7376]